MKVCKWDSSVPVSEGRLNLQKIFVYVIFLFSKYLKQIFMQNYLLLDILRYILNSGSFSKGGFVEPIFEISCDTMLKGKRRTIVPQHWQWKTSVIWLYWLLSLTSSQKLNLLIFRWFYKTDPRKKKIKPNVMQRPNIRYEYWSGCCI